MSKIPGYLTIAEAAARLKLDESQVRRHCKGVTCTPLKAVKVGRSWLIPAEHLLDFQPRPRGNPAFMRN